MERALHLQARNDRVHHAVRDEEFRALKAFGQGGAKRAFDDPRTGETNQGARLGDISHAVERSARAAGSYGIVEDYGGHGIGSEMHMDPPVPNAGRPGRGPVLAEGMALAVEPLLVLGGPGTRLLDDGWTVVTEDGSPAAHFEHTVAITADGPLVLTAADGGRDGFARLAQLPPRELARSNS